VALPIQIVPSVLPCDFAKLGAEIEALDAAGVDHFQWDVMDGQFVPNLTFGPDVIAAARKHTTKPFEAHLMVLTPDVLAARYVEAGCSRLIVHAEACPHLHRTLGNIASMGANPAVALNPHTPVSEIEHVLDLVDMVLIMTVNPGFGGQSYIATMEPKIAQLRALIERRGLSGWWNRTLHHRRRRVRRSQRLDRRHRVVPLQRGSCIRGERPARQGPRRARLTINVAARRPTRDGPIATP
jgi:ribulose-phosphate 3-epimerase